MTSAVLSFMLLVGGACALVIPVPARDYMTSDQSWMLWKMAHGKSYEDLGSEQVRYAIWKDNLRKIENHNNAGSHSYTLKINHFGDLTSDEFRYHMNGFNGQQVNQTKGVTYMSPANVNLPEEVDWRTKGYVTPIKNQGQCGSCWAFSATGSLEGQTFKKTGKLPSISEQQLVDCSNSFGNQGCQGGLMDDAFKYIKANGGIDSEASYPYKGVNDKCSFKKDDVIADDAGFVDIPSGDEAKLTEAIATVGPISVAIDASHFSFQFYHSGVYDAWLLCSSKNLDHGVLAVGYGLYGDNKTPYYWVKNSWGTGWGIKGYIRMSRNKKNQCGIATAASYPLV